MRTANPSKAASRVILRGLLMAATVLLAAGCIPLGRVLNGTPFPNDVLWDNSCELPCWHYIVPGETTKDAAREIVQGLDFVESSSVRERTDDPDWTWIEWDARSPYTGNGSIGMTDGVVESIVVEGIFDTTLSQLVERHGPPERYQVDASGGGMAAIWEYDFYYPARGAMFEAAHEAYPGKNSPTPVYAEAEVWRMGLLEAGTLGEQIERRFGEYPPLRPLHRWHGFDPLPTPTPVVSK